MYFISAAVILLPSLDLTVQVALPYNRTGRASLLCSKPEGKSSLERPRRKWVDNIGTDLQEVGCG